MATGTLKERLYKKLPARRTTLKVVHAIMIPLTIWFFLVQPRDVVPIGMWAFKIHSNLALIFVSICLFWSADYMWRGFASRPGPKLPKWARRVHSILHRVIIWGLFTVAITGFLLGLSSAIVLYAGGFLPIAPAMNWPMINHYVGRFHLYEYYVFFYVIVFHALFHTWRHFHLRDNVLRIMAPKYFHKWL